MRQLSDYIAYTYYYRRINVTKRIIERKAIISVFLHIIVPYMNVQTPLWFARKFNIVALCRIVTGGTKVSYRLIERLQ